MDYGKMKLTELREIAKEKGLRNISAMKKGELAEFLTQVDMMQKKSAPQPEAEAASPAPASAEKQEKKRSLPGRKRGSNSDAGAEKKPLDKTEEKAAENSTSADESEERISENRTSAGEQFVVRLNTAEKDAEKAEEKVAERRPEYASSAVPAQVSAAEEKPREADRPESNETAGGILEVLQDGYGFLRSDNYMPGDKDIYISPAQIRKFGLKTGDIVVGPIRKKTSQNEKFSALLYIDSVNGLSPDIVAKRGNFEDMTPIFPDSRLSLDYDLAPISLRIVDLFSPIGKGQRGMIVSPPKAGKTTLLKQIAKRISVAYPDMNLIVLLIDERPEEVTDIKESIEGPNAEVIYSTFDELPEHHKRVSEMVIERAKRLVECGKDVVILIDSITRLSRAYNLTVAPSGRTLSGGLDPAALHMPKKFFGAARNMREGGSLTILATALIDTGSRMDDVVFEEFKGTGNMELVLDRNLSEKRVFPAIDIAKSGTRRDDLLLTKEEIAVLDLIHAKFRGARPEEVTEDIIRLLSRTRNNKEFLDYAVKIFARKN